MRSASATTTQKLCPSCHDHFSGDALFCPNDGSRLVPAEGREPEPSHDAEASPPGPRAPEDSYLGREISGHIQIRELAGVGAMGRVYRAFQRGIDRDVAVKILHRELSANPQLVARFHREAKVASRLQHPNVVHVHLAGQLPDGALYIVMEYLDGQSLQTALADTEGAVPLPRALHIALQLCDAVGEAHAQGIVHRDLKPENVMLVRRGEDADYVKVLDFGIARLSWGEQSMATAAGLIFGTARYISPEGAQGESVGPSGDVYAIATLLYQMLAGRTPFEGEQAVGILIQQIHDNPPPLKSMPLAASVPDTLADIVMQNLSKDRNARAPDARALGRQLLDVMRVSGSSPRISGVSFPEVPQVDLLATPGAGAATTRWTPPVSVQAQLALSPTPAIATTDYKSAAQSGGPPAPEKAMLEMTLDDASLGPSKTPSLNSTVRLPVTTAPPVVVPPAFPPVEGRRSSPSKPFSNVETTLSDSHVAAQPEDSNPATQRKPRRFVRFGALVLILFIGLGGAGVYAAHRLGAFQSTNSATNIEDIIIHARIAAADGRWDSPAGDNVFDLTSEGLALWPGEPRLMEIRMHASEELMKRAIAAKASGDLALAVRDARLATRFDPHDHSKRALVHEYENDIAHQGESLTLLADAGDGKPPRGQTTGPRASLETSPGKPRMGQQVDFAAKISGDSTKTVSDPRFTVTGPGLAAGAKLAALSDGAVYRAGFTFLVPGRYEVTFLAKVDGASVRGSRIVIVEGAKPAASAGEDPGPPPTPSAAPSGSAKWL